MEDAGSDDPGTGIADATDKVDNKTDEIFEDSNNRNW